MVEFGLSFASYHLKRVYWIVPLLLATISVICFLSVAVFDLGWLGKGAEFYFGGILALILDFAVFFRVFCPST